MYINKKYKEEDQFEHFPKVPGVYGIVVNNKLLSLHHANDLQVAAISRWTDMVSNINFQPRYLILRKAYFNPEKYTIGLVLLKTIKDEWKRKVQYEELLEKYKPILNKNKKEIPFTLDECLAATEDIDISLLENKNYFSYIPSNIISKKDETLP